METRGLIRRIAKADFADVVGVCLRGDVVVAAMVRKRLNAVRVVSLGRLVLEGPVEARTAAASSFLRSWVESTEAEPSRVAIVVDRGLTLLAGLAIPASAASNAADVVRFELDRLLPVPPDSLHWAIATRPLGTVGERLGVTVLAAPQAAVEEAAAVVRDAGLPVSAVTVEPAALADYIGFSGLPLAAAATRCGSREFLTLCADGAVVSSHHLDRRSRGLLESALREMEVALPERTGEAPVRLRENVLEEGEATFAAVAPADLFPAGAEVGEAEAVAVGAALGLVGESLRPVNLLPESLVQTATGFGLRELALSGAVALMGLTLLGVIGARNIAIRGALTDEVDRLEPQVEQAMRREEKNAEMLGMVERLEAKSRSRVLQYMRAVTDLVPPTAYLTTFRYREDRIEVDGISDKASDLIAILESSPMFTGVEFTAPTTKYLASQERFSLRMRLEQ